MLWPERLTLRACAVVWSITSAIALSSPVSAQPSNVLTPTEVAPPIDPGAAPAPLPPPTEQTPPNAPTKPAAPQPVPELRLAPPESRPREPESAPPVALPTPGPTPEAKPQVARLDYVDGSFFLRAFNDQMLLMPSGRMQIDTYAYAGKGVEDYHRSNGTGLTTQIFFRRFVIEAGGLVGKYFFWWMGGSFAPLGLDRDQNLVATPAGVYDGFVGVRALPTLRIFFGQFNAPVTMENVTSSRWLDFMERALLVRTFAIPENKGIGPMAWGETKHKEFEYQVAGMSEDGTIGRPSVDGRFNLEGRLMVRPLARRDDALNRFHIGGSMRYGKRDPSFLQWAAPNMTTPGGFAYWSSTYGEGAEQTVVMLDRRQTVVAAEGYLPFQRWDIRGEFAWTRQERREALSDDRSASLRGGLLDGYGVYGQFSVWPVGTPRINGNPASTYGIVGPPPPKDRANYGLQLVLRGEAIRLNYDSNSRFGDPGSLNPNTTRIRVNAYQACANFWATKHVRLTAEYSLYQFPGVPIEENQAIAPGVKAKTVPNAHFLSEFSFRVGLAL